MSTMVDTLVASLSIPFRASGRRERQREFSDSPLDAELEGVLVVLRKTRVCPA